MPKVILNDLASLANETSAISTINANNNAIEEGFNNTVSRDGTSPNTMEAMLDMNNNRLVNVPLIPLSNADVATKYYVDYMVGQNPDTTPTNPSDAIIEGHLTVNGGVTFDDGFYWDETNNRLSINSPINSTIYAGLTFGSDILIHNQSDSEICLQVARYSNTATAPACFIGTRSRGTLSLPTVVQSGDRLLLLQGHGFDGTDYANAGMIELFVATTPGSNDMPGRWIFSTSSDGSHTPTERLRISHDGTSQFTGNLTLTSGAQTTLTINSSGGNSAIEIGRTDNVASSSFIDFHSGATSVDYDSRIISTGGTGSIGQGNLEIIASNIDMNSSAVTLGTIEIGNTTDTTLARSSAGNVSIEGNVIYRAGGTDVPVADGGTGVSSLTAYAVICGGTTSTGAVQSIASVGTAGQVLTSNGASALPTFQTASSAGATVMTAQATTSGSSFDFTGIGSTCTEIVVYFEGVSLTGTDDILVQIGDSGGVETTGYVSGSIGDSGNLTSTSGYIISIGSTATKLNSGVLKIYKVDTNKWASSHIIGTNTASSADLCQGWGYKTLSATLDRVRITATGANTFDTGSVNVIWRP